MAAADAAGAGAGTLGGLGADDEQPMLLLCTQAARLFALGAQESDRADATLRRSPSALTRHVRGTPHEAAIMLAYAKLLPHVNVDAFMGLRARAAR